MQRLNGEIHAAEGNRWAAQDFLSEWTQPQQLHAVTTEQDVIAAHQESRTRIGQVLSSKRNELMVNGDLSVQPPKVKKVL